MLLDVTVITQKLGSIAEAGKNLTSLQMLVKDKPVPRKNVSQTMAGLLKRNGSKKDSSSGPAPDGEGTAEGKDKDKEEGDGDADEDGESLGIIPAGDEEKDDSAPLPAETTAVESETVQTQPQASPPALPDKSDKSDEPTGSGQPPTTPPKDSIPIRSSTEVEAQSSEPTAQEETTTDEILTAPPTSKEELPVAPVEPLDGDTKSPAPVEEATSPLLPPPDDKPTVEPVEENEKQEEDKPELPEKE